MTGIADVVWEVMVDWDMTDWAATPDFTQPEDDISVDVQYVNPSRGKEREAGNSPAATCQLRIKPGLHAKYSPVNSIGPLHGRLLPWRAVRCRAYYDGNYYTKFTGFISSISIDPSPDKQSVSIYCTDGMDLLARQFIVEDWDAKVSMTEGETMGAILDAAGWSAAKRSLSAGGDVTYPVPVAY